MPGIGGMTSAPITPSGAPETVTIKNSDGSSTSVQGSAGQDVKITEADGSGKSTSYDVNLGQGAGVSGTNPAGGGTAAPGGRLASGANVQHVTADAQGQAVIHDGKETITVQEQPGTQGSVNVTLTDPSGHPQTYEVDPTGTPTPGQGGTPGGPAAAYQAGGGAGGGQASGLGAALGHGASGAGGGVAGGGIGGGGAASGVVGGGGVAGGGVAGGGVASTGDVHSAASPNWPGQGQQSGTGVSGAQSTGGPAGASGSGQSSGAGGGMPMMGGMGGMGGGAGGDQERGASQWRIQGQLFDDPSANDVAAGVSSMLDEDPRQQSSDETGGV
jgi:hypothetical protein